MKNRLLILSIILLMAAVITGCDNSDKSDDISEVAKEDGEYTVYYPNEADTRIFSYVYKSDTNDVFELVLELLDELKKGGYEGNDEAVIKKELGEISQKLDSKGLVTIYFTSAYQAMEGIEEVLFRACVVKTLCQLEKVNCVEFYVDDKPLMLNDGSVVVDSGDNPNEITLPEGTKEVGIMTDYDFVNSIGSEENYLSKDVYTLYFASEDGTMLVESYVDIEYDSTVSMEQLVVLQIIDGPVSEGNYRSVNPDTKINKITTKDNICYVDLSKELLETPDNIPLDISIYSIVDSLVELNTVNKVQILIDGNIITDYSEDGLIERNLDIIDRKGEEIDG